MNSTIELHGDTKINNTFNGLGAADGGKITSEDLPVIDSETINPDLNKELRTGVWTSDSGSKITLTGKTTIQNVDEGLYVDGGSKIISGDLTIIGSESKKTVGVNVGEPDSLIELKGKTTIQNFDVGLFAGNNLTIKMINRDIEAAQSTVENKIEAKKVALIVTYGGHIDLTNVSVTARIAGLQFLAFSNSDLEVLEEPQKYQSNEINLTNTKLHAENGTGIFVGAFIEKNIENDATPSIGTVNLNNSEIHANVLLGDGIFGDKKLWEDKKKIKSCGMVKMLRQSPMVLSH
ncbi:hypothetical protein HNQ69_000356 [Bartonella callosciuri]|uniref:Uncharacterized protein n=1 Tax=Bartonella callosciuri TaxID=686223 RepID=A0A840NVG5_9HYPH|nr:hypothetical protein [Bartonella callosciuri]